MEVGRTVYMAVTNDVYELPVAMEDTLSALSKSLRINYCYLTCKMRKNSTPIIKCGKERLKIIKVTI